MFFKSNGAILRKEQYLRDIGQLGITYNGSTREEVVNYYFSTTKTIFRYGGSFYE
jgi:zinc protease